VRSYKADVHIHSCLSPCASLEMSPSAIAAQASRAGLDLIAIADHNSTRNLPALAACAPDYPAMCFLYGIEVNTAEEAHVLCLFGDLHAAEALGEKVLQTLPDFAADAYGDQVYVDKDEVILGRVERYLINACAYSIDQLCAMAHEAGGLCIPAHVDKPSFSLIAQLGFVPDEPFDALELSGHTAVEDEPLRRLGAAASSAASYPFITSSDAHYLHDIGRFYTEFDAATVSFSSFTDALRAGSLSMRAR
jgi:3',5'-nucleoside bisphosphate phosphatase